MATLTVKVTANAARDEISGTHDGAVKVRVRAKPVKGQANRAVCKVIANHLRLPVSKVTVKAGAAATRKVLNIDGLSEADLEALLPR